MAASSGSYCCPPGGVQSSRKPVLGAEGSLLGAASDVTGQEQSREEEGSVHGLTEPALRQGKPQPMMPCVLQESSKPILCQYS